MDNFNVPKICRATPCSQPKHLAVVTFNIVRGLISAFDKYRSEIVDMITTHSISVLVETHLDEHEPVLNISNYSHLRKTREKSMGGGISIFVRKEYVACPLIAKNENVMCVRVKDPEIDSSLLLVAVYSPPKNSVLFVDGEAIRSVIENLISLTFPTERLLICGHSDARIGGYMAEDANFVETGRCGVAETIILENVDKKANQRGKRLIKVCSIAGGLRSTD